MKDKKFYKYEGPGLWLGCTIILQAFSIEDAEKVILEELRRHSFTYNGRDSIEEILLDSSGIIYIDTGDY